MKARIKATGEIVDIAEYSTIYAENHINCFYPNELDILDNLEGYWTRLEHQYAGMAMQGILSNANHALLDRENNAEGIAKIASKIAHALVEKYKKEKRKE